MMRGDATHAMDDTTGIYVGALALCLVLSAFFNAAETSLFSLGRVRLRRLKERHARTGALIERMIGNPDRLLSTLLIGNNMANTAASAAGTALAIELTPGHPVLAATVAVTVILLLFAEITPKVLAASFAEPVALAVARPLDLISWAATPLIKVLSLAPRALLWVLGAPRQLAAGTTSEDIKTMAVLGREEGAIGRDEQEMIHSVVEFGALTADQIMVSRVDLLSLDLALPREEAIDLVIESGHSRIPVYRGSKDHIDGVLQARDFLLAWRRGQAEDIGRFVSPPFFIPESMRVGTLFREFRARKERMAIVIDEYGGTAGIVTLEDVLGEIVGEVVDEDHDLTLLAARRDGTVAVSGQIAIDDLNAKTGLALPDEEFQTLSGLIVNHLGRVPYPGEEVALDGAVFQVLDADQRRVYRLAMKKAAGG
jgi:CBS domain containing-hemolysin-like protein